MDEDISPSLELKPKNETYVSSDGLEAPAEQRRLIIIRADNVFFTSDDARDSADLAAMHVLSQAINQPAGILYEEWKVLVAELFSVDLSPNHDDDKKTDEVDTAIDIEVDEEEDESGNPIDPREVDDKEPEVETISLSALISYDQRKKSYAELCKRKETDDISENMLEQFDHYVISSLHINKDIHSFLGLLERHGWMEIAVYSNLSSHLLDGQLIKADLNQQLVAVATPDSVDATFPHVEYLVHCLGAVGIEMTEAIVIDTDVEFLDKASQHGAMAICFGNEEGFDFSATSLVEIFEFIESSEL